MEMKILLYMRSKNLCLTTQGHLTRMKMTDILLSVSVPETILERTLEKKHLIDDQSM